MTKKAFVTGWPVGHSKSPSLHGYWLSHYGIDGSYEPLPVREEDFDSFLESLNPEEFAGGNVTIPHKEKAFAKISRLDTAARAIGAVNTLWFDDGILNGGNTDAYGFSANLDDFAPEWRNGKKALVLGAGGAARAVVYALQSAGYKTIQIANRTLQRAENLAAEFGEMCSAHPLDGVSGSMPELDFIVNTTSLGMAGHGGEGLPELTSMKPSAIVTDIVYTPLKTPFLAAAQEQGLTTVDGLGMLLHQAVPGFEKWFGVTPTVTADLRNHILEKL